MRQTGFTRQQKTIIAARDQLCVVHTDNFDPTMGPCAGQFLAHHRLGRGIGSVQSRNRVANGLLICASINTLLEQDARLARYARERGWVLRTDLEIETVPVWVPTLQQFVWLNDAGDYLSQPYGEAV